MKKRILSVILCMAILLTTFMIVPITASAYDYDYEIDGVRYAEIDELSVEIVGYNSKTLPENLVVPATVEGKNVTRIADYGFSRSAIKSVVLPETVTEIDMYGFLRCEQLEIFTSLGGLTSIKRDAFWQCKNLKELNLPDSLETIGSQAFDSCESLTSIKLPKNLTTLEYAAFRYCTSIKEVTINSELKTLSNAFAGISSLTDVKFEERTTPLTLGSGAFSNCTGLTDFDFSYIGSIGHGAFENCTGFTSIILPKDAAITLDNSSFQGCTNLKTVRLPDCIKIIPDRCFYGCTSLESIETAKLTEIEDGAFYNCKSLKDFSFAQDNDLSNVGNDAFYNCELLTEISLPDIKYIGEEAFYNCYNLSEVTFGEGLKSITARAFYNCYSLAEISLPGIEYLYEYTFENCYSLSKVTLKEGTRFIGERAFFNCFSLYDINIPKTVESIGGLAFGCFEEDGNYYAFSDFTVTGVPDSLADEYAKAYGLKYAIQAPNLTSISNTDSGIKISFEKLSGVSGKYRVYRKTAGASWTALADVTTASYTDTTATAGTKYTYTVKFIGYDGTTSLYDKDGLSVTRLKTPSVSKIENTTSGAKITWGAVAGAKKYRAYVKTSDGWKSLGDTEATSFVHTDAVSGTSYTYTVKAFDSDGSGSAHNSTGWSNKFITTPFIKNAEVTNSGIKVTWDKVAGAENYRVFIKNGSSWKGLATVSGTTDNYMDKTATVGNSYTYTIRCMDSSGNFVSDYDKEGFTVRYLETPQITGFENIDGGTVISWNEIEGAEKYRLYVKRDGSWTILTDTADISFVHTDLEDGTEYTYTVRCISEDSKTLESGYNSIGFSNLYERPEIKVLTGDADLDGELSVLDASLIQMFLVGKKTLEGDALIAADADLDGEISVLDASLIQMILVGKK